MKKIPVLVFSRIVGYFSVVNRDWNLGKQEEFKERKMINVEKALKKINLD